MQQERGDDREEYAAEEDQAGDLPGFAEHLFELSLEADQESRSLNLREQKVVRMLSNPAIATIFPKVYISAWLFIFPASAPIIEIVDMIEINQPINQVNQNVRIPRYLIPCK